MLIKVVAMQLPLGRGLTLSEKLALVKQRPDLVILPEYQLVEPSIPDHVRAALEAPRYREYLAHLSDELSTTLVGGSIIEATAHGLVNVSLVYDRGNEIARYEKQFPMPGEIKSGIAAGKGPVVVEVDGMRLGLLICGDVLHDSAFTSLSGMQPDLIAVPTASPYRPDDNALLKEARDETHFRRGSEIAGAYVIKSGGIGSLFGRPLQGRTLIAAPWGILERVEPTQEQRMRMITVTLDIGELREFRKRQNGNNRS
jgi:predicted amidohydrolase